MDELVFARLLHVLGVVLWIGGVAMVTLVLLPTLMRMASMSEAMAFFQQFRRRFAAQARISTLVVGISGFYMVYELNAWIWLLFSVMLFVQEPRSRRQPTTQSAAVPITPEMFVRIQRKHMFLLILSLITIAGAVAGSHGWLVGM